MEKPTFFVSPFQSLSKKSAAILKRNMECVADDVCLQPGILSRDALISALKWRAIKENELATMDKSDLVQLYETHVTPLPQRLDCDCRRWRRIHGYMITAMDVGTQCKPKQEKINGFCVTQNEETSATSERLKPVISKSTEDNVQRKININRKRSRTDSDTLTTDKITTLSPTISTDDWPTKKSKSMDPETKSIRKPITWP